MIKRTEPLSKDASSYLVRWLTTRTLEGLAHWEQLPNGFISHVTSSMFVQFITHASPQGQSWRLFKVHDLHGELLRTTAPASAIDSTPLSVAIEALFLTIAWAGSHLIH
jgi:hypothetical protein